VGEFADAIAGKSARILVIDIETRPILSYTWGLYKQSIYPAQVVDFGGVLCFAAKWLDEKRIHFHSDHHDGHAEMVQAAWDLIDEADIVIGYNSKGFDVKHLAREFIESDMPPPAPHQDVDLLTIARRRFRWPSNKLVTVSEALGIGTKVRHEGFVLWRDCLEGDEKAWRTMKRYNIQDVRLTEAAYFLFRPWIKSHPHVGILAGQPWGCPNCGSSDFTENGATHTSVSEYRLRRCSGCGANYRSTVRQGAAITRGA
jgi:hypothetical protein